LDEHKSTDVKKGSKWEIMNNKADFIKEYTTYIKRDGADKLLELLEKSDFFTAPASTRYHDSVEGGLCHHSLEVYGWLRRELIDDMTVTMETVAIVSLLHDICKTGFYKVSSRNTKDEHGKWIQVPYYEVEDKFPVGHSEKSIIMIMQCMELSSEEILAINSHMGGFDSRTQMISNAFAESELAVQLHIADLKATYFK